jgi:hypothetical protein
MHYFGSGSGPIRFFILIFMKFFWTGSGQKSKGFAILVFWRLKNTTDTGKRQKYMLYFAYTRMCRSDFVCILCFDIINAIENQRILSSTFSTINASYYCMSKSPNMRPIHTVGGLPKANRRSVPSTVITTSMTQYLKFKKNRWRWLYDTLIIHCIAGIVAEPFLYFFTSKYHTLYLWIAYKSNPIGRIFLF